jgi:hypothetical protein
MKRYRDIASGQFVKNVIGELAEKVGDASIISVVFGSNKTQRAIDDVYFGYEDDFSYLDIYDIDYESPV